MLEKWLLDYDERVRAHTNMANVVTSWIVQKNAGGRHPDGKPFLVMENICNIREDKCEHKEYWFNNAEEAIVHIHAKAKTGDTVQIDLDYTIE